jgi:replication-associated recombination protein RarA
MKEWEMVAKSKATPKKGGNERIVEVAQKSMSVNDMWARLQLQILNAKNGESNYHGSKETVEKMIENGALQAPQYISDGDRKMLTEKYEKLEKVLEKAKMESIKEDFIENEISKRLAKNKEIEQ